MMEGTADEIVLQRGLGFRNNCLDFCRTSNHTFGLLFGAFAPFYHQSFRRK